MRLSLVILLGALLAPGLAHAQDATTAGEVTTPHPTLEHISIEWAIDGDDDEDGVVAVRFREEGSSAWRDGLPLVRVPAGSNEGFAWGNRHAGSLFGLRPGTTYEIELSLNDPDGGAETRTVTEATRPVPTVAAGAPTVAATPSTLASVLGSASAGDVVLLGAGTYTGEFWVSNDGAADAPIVVRGSARDDVVIEGDLRMDGRSHVWVEDLTVRGRIKFNGATGVVVRGCRVEASADPGDGISAFGGGSTDGYFADNEVIGNYAWEEARLGASGGTMGDGIVMTGPGNVIEHNYISGFRDCVSLLEGGAVSNQVSIDILGNDLDVCLDDAIEADFAMGNVRVMRNRMVNTFIALSSQPSLGGPTWFIRNVSFANVFQELKPNRGSVGDILLHNTIVSPGDAFGVYAGVTWSRAVFRNNLFIGGTGGGTYNGFSNGDGRVLHAPDTDEATSDFDYDGYGSIGTGTFAGRLGGTTFSSYAEMTSMTSEVHATEVDLSIFAASFDFPDDPLTMHTVPDLRLAAGSAAIDRGQPLANVNDGFAGAAPDLGAFELGAALPPYGPRTGEPVCGNGVIEGAEGCDDGNTSGGDGCSAGCLVEDGDGGVVMPGDGGVVMPGTDGGPRTDGAVPPGVDGGPGGGDDGGCGCRVGARRAPGWSAFGLLACLAVVVRRRARMRG